MRTGIGGQACRLAVILALALAALADPGAVRAQFDPSRVPAEPPDVAARFAEPSVTYATPGFGPGRTDFPTHAEAIAFVRELAGRAPAQVRIETIGESQQGRPIPLVVLSGPDGVSAAVPTVLVLAQQHGNEPAGGEAALALAGQLAGPDAALLTRVNVLVVPRANPDGAERFVRTTASGADVNRDHLLLQTPEARALAGVARRYRPDVVLDLHEFTVGDRWVKKFGVLQKYDALIQAATVGNLQPAIAAEAERQFVGPVRQALAAEGLTSSVYHTTSPDPSDKVVSMGGVQPDTGRNVNGLRQAISLLIETRGVGIGRAHFARRVHTHVHAALTVIRQAASRGPRLVALTRAADAAAAGAACTGTLTIRAETTLTTRAMTFLDAVTGADRAIVVPWRSAATLRVRGARPRPCGYVLAGFEAAAVDRLRLLGVRLQQVRGETLWRVERYDVVSMTGGARQDARGAIDDGAEVRLYTVRTSRQLEVVPAGSWYVDLAQPLQALVAAALEPDSQNSFAASALVDPAHGGLRRVTAAPPADALR
jgi:hypothetical protein